MSAEIKRFRRSKADRARIMDAAQLLLLDCPELPPPARVALQHLTAETDQAQPWVFVMISPTETRRAVGLIQQHVDRPDAATRLFTILLTHLEWDSGRVAADRATLAKDAVMTPTEVSRALSALASLGICRKTGIGRATAWFVNPSIAWRGAEPKRQQALGRQLRLVMPE